MDIWQKIAIIIHKKIRFYVETRSLVIRVNTTLTCFALLRAQSGILSNFLLADFFLSSIFVLEFLFYACSTPNVILIKLMCNTSVFAQFLSFLNFDHFFENEDITFSNNGQGPSKIMYLRLLVQICMMIGWYTYGLFLN